jgi:predicted short-subunit dehydrogenase-like oxidoreductase (DUF2520 family)
MRELERDRNSHQTALPALALVGPGRVGRSLAAAATRTGIPVSPAARDEVPERCREAEAVLLCVPDAAIAGACEAVLAAAPRLRFLGHTSGATGLDALAPAAAAGAEVFCLHPLQTVPSGDTDLSGAPCAVSASAASGLELARSLATALGMAPFEIRDEDRPAYHAAACLASNFLVALEESAADLLARSGVENPRELLAPLVLRTAANWSENGAAALTGPIARGDEETVERHLAALAETHPELLELYSALAARTRAIAAAEAAA